MEPKDIIKQLFASFDGWDDMDTMAWTFSDVTLRSNGKKYSSASLDLTQGTLILYHDDVNVAEQFAVKVELLPIT